MGYFRILTAVCDKCYKDYNDEGFWYKDHLMAALAKDGWEVTPKSCICPDCR